MARHRGRRLRAEAAAARAGVVRRGGRRGRPDRSVDRLLPPAADPRFASRSSRQEVAGFGASGRNGGWCTALFPTSWSTLAARGGADGALRQHRAMQETVRRGRPGRGGGGDRRPVPTRRDRGAGAHARPARPDDRGGRDRARAGFTEDDLRLLGPAEAREQLSTDGALGATFTPHCAAIHPARLVRGLARVVERLGVDLFEQHPGPRHRARRGAHRRRRRARRGGPASHRGLHRRVSGAAPRASHRCTR